MSEGSLFNSGFLGASFSWWIGQIAPDSTWRDNILPGKFESVDQITGWGRRYKVRIIGLHDQGETEIASEQLPWAQVMYPVTVVVVKQRQVEQQISDKEIWCLVSS